MWHGIFTDAWRDILRAKKKELGYSNEDIAEMINTSESAVRRDLCDRSDPPLSRIVAIANALGVPIADLFMPSLPNGMKIQTLVEEYTRLAEENTVLKADVGRLRARIDELTDEILKMNRYYMKQE